MQNFAASLVHLNSTNTTSQLASACSHLEVLEFVNTLARTSLRSLSKIELSEHDNNWRATALMITEGARHSKSIDL